MKTPKKLPEEIVDLLLPRLADEYTAHYQYNAIANWCQGVGYFKAAAFFKSESADELTHAHKIEQYLTDWNVIPELPTIKQPTLEFKTLGDVIQKGYDMEYALYEEYEDTSMKVFKEGDVCTFDFLQFFRGVQTASTAEYSDKINMLEGVSGGKFEMLMLEEKLFG